ncbi:hypothetical protein D3C84_920900 [compost metagenome]
MDAGAGIGHQEEQGAAALGIAFQRHRVAAQAHLLAVQAGHGLGRIHHRRQIPGLLLEAALLAEGTGRLRGLVADFRHGLEGLLVLARHQLQPVGFPWLGQGQQR